MVRGYAFNARGQFLRHFLWPVLCFLENAKKFLTMLYHNSRFPKISYGKKLHDHVVKSVDNVMYDHWDWDFEEFATRYSYYENMVVTALRQSWGKDSDEDAI